MPDQRIIPLHSSGPYPAIPAFVRFHNIVAFFSGYTQPKPYRYLSCLPEIWVRFPITVSFCPCAPRSSIPPSMEWNRRTLQAYLKAAECYITSLRMTSCCGENNTFLNLSVSATIQLCPQSLTTLQDPPFRKWDVVEKDASQRWQARLKDLVVMEKVLASDSSDIKVVFAQHLRGDLLILVSERSPCIRGNPCD